MEDVSLIVDLMERMTHARAKHPQFTDGLAHALAVVGAEFRELEQAVESEGVERARDEALDVAVTALRLYAGEWMSKGDE